MTCLTCWHSMVESLDSPEARCCLDAYFENKVIKSKIKVYPSKHRCNEYIDRDVKRLQLKIDEARLELNRLQDKIYLMIKGDS